MLAAALECIAARLAAATSTVPLPPDVLRARLVEQLSTPEVWPYLCLYLETAALSARGDTAIKDVGERIGRGFLAWGQAQLDSRSPERDAARLLVSIEGMLMLRSIRLGDVADAAV